MTETGKNWWWIPIILMIGVIIYLIGENRSQKEIITTMEYNMGVVQDSLRITKLDNGNLLAERKSFLLSEKTMKELLKSSGQKVSDLEKQLDGALAQVAILQSGIHIDSIIIMDTLIRQDTNGIFFGYQDDWFRFRGELYHPESWRLRLTDIYMDIPLTIGMTDNKTFFATTPNPYVTFTDVTSSVNIKTMTNRRRWAIGVHVGPGIYYDIWHRQPAAGIGIQIGVSYNFL